MTIKDLIDQLSDLDPDLNIGAIEYLSRYDQNHFVTLDLEIKRSKNQIIFKHDDFTFCKFDLKK